MLVSVASRLAFFLDEQQQFARSCRVNDVAAPTPKKSWKVAVTVLPEETKVQPSPTLLKKL